MQDKFNVVVIGDEAVGKSALIIRVSFMEAGEYNTDTIWARTE